MWESASVWESVWERECVGVREQVCGRESERASVWERERVRVCGRESASESV